MHCCAAAARRSEQCMLVPSNVCYVVRPRMSMTSCSVIIYLAELVGWHGSNGRCSMLHLGHTVQGTKQGARFSAVGDQAQSSPILT